MNKYFAPGCALTVYKPGLAEKLSELLSKFDDIEKLEKCCHFEPGLSENTHILNACPGCDWRYSRLYKGITTATVWEYLADKDIPLPDYKGKRMSIHDACSVRGKNAVYDAVRTLLKRMNIVVVEPENTREKSRCCGQTSRGKISGDKLLERIKVRADSLSEQDVAVYCATCMKFLYNGGKTAHHMIDLIFGEESDYSIANINEWLAAVEQYVLGLMKK